VPAEMPIRGGARWTTGPMSGSRLDLHNISIDFAAASAGYAVSPISTAAGSAGYRTGTTALVSCRTAHASTAERAAGVLLG